MFLVNVSNERRFCVRDTSNVNQREAKQSGKQRKHNSDGNRGLLETSMDSPSVSKCDLEAMGIWLAGVAVWLIPATDIGGVDGCFFWVAANVCEQIVA